MDLGLKNKTALVCAASKGLGRACAEALAAEGVRLVITARGAEALEETASYLRLTYQAEVHTVVGDITTEAGRTQALDVCQASIGMPDILVNNAGGPKPGDFRDWGRAEWQAAVEANMFTPIELIKACTPAMMERKWGRVVNITSSAVKAPIAELGLSNGARSGLTGFVAGVARQLAEHGITINNLLPGLFYTDRLKGNFAFLSSKTGKTHEEIFAAKSALNPTRRLGNPAEFGSVCAFMCSQQAAYLNGQNILLDGGNYPGTF